MVYILANKEMLEEEDVVMMNRMVNNTPEYHTLEQHNFYAGRNWLCPYCNLGSKPIPKSEFEEWLQSKQKLGIKK